MSQNLQSKPIKSPYRRGADDGFGFGVYLSVMLMAMIFTQRFAILAPVTIGMFLAVPAVLYALMRRYDRQMGRAANFAANWMHGVMIFVCGALVSGAVLAVYMRWIDPEFISSQMNLLAGYEGRFPGTAFDQSAVLARQMVEANFMPTAISIAVELIFFEMFTGSCLALGISALLAFLRPRGYKTLERS